MYKLILFTFLLFPTLVCSAKNIEWSDHTYSHFSKEEPLRFFLESVAAEQETSIVVSDKVEGIISVYFKEKKLEFIFNELVSVYGLISYYDGDILYVYKAEEKQIATATMTRTSIFALEYELRKQNILDHNAKWTVNEEENSVTFSGTKRFVDIVLNKAKQLDKNNLTTIFETNTSKGDISFSNILSSNANYKKVIIHKYKVWAKKEKESSKLVDKAHKLAVKDE